MTNFENIKNMTIDELTKWLDKNGTIDGSLWDNWFAKHYCNYTDCPSIIVKTEDGTDVECGYCELHHKCLHFQDLEDVPSNKEVIKLWLSQEVEIEKKE